MQSLVPSHEDLLALYLSLWGFWNTLEARYFEVRRSPSHVLPMPLASLLVADHAGSGASSAASQMCQR